MNVREKAQAMRLEQERKDKRMRNIIIAVVTAIVLAVSLAVTYVVMTTERSDEPASPEIVAAQLGDFKDGKPIVFSHKGFGVKDDSLPTITEYFDYSCHHCADYAVEIDPTVSEGMKAGKYNIEYQPVPSVNMPYNVAATSASVLIANKAPEQWLDFHHGAMKFFQDTYSAGNGSILHSLTKSTDKLKEIAASVGVPQDVVDAIKPNLAVDYLEKAHTAWLELAVDDRPLNQQGKPSFGTPEFHVNGNILVQRTQPGVDGFLADLDVAMAKVKK